MKYKILVAALITAGLTACSSTPTNLSGGAGIDPGASATTPIADQRLAASEFKKQGVKVIYSLFGNLEAIEVTGYAPTWGASQNSEREAYRAAELEAKKSLIDFIYKETITSTVSVVMISENLEHAKDNNINKFNTNKAGNDKVGDTGTADDLVAVDDDIAKKQAAGTTDSKENTAERNNALKIASKMRTTITSSNRGILSGLYLKEGSIINDGKAVMVVMRWDKKNAPTRVEIGKLMSM
jgi:hypothetical protein